MTAIHEHHLDGTRVVFCIAGSNHSKNYDLAAVLTVVLSAHMVKSSGNM